MGKTLSTIALAAVTLVVAVLAVASGQAADAGETWTVPGRTFTPDAAANAHTWLVAGAVLGIVGLAVNWWLAKRENAAK